MYYDRQIKYFDYKKDGVRQRGAGFLKIEVRDDICTLTLQISSLLPVENSTVQVYGLWENREEMLGNLLMQGGRGNKELRFARKNESWDKENRSDGVSGPVYEGLQAIRIPLMDGCELYCQVGKDEPKSAGTQREVKNMSAELEALQGPKGIGKLDEVEETPIEREVQQDAKGVGRLDEVEEAPIEHEVRQDAEGVGRLDEVEETAIERELVKTEREALERTPSPQPRPMLEEKWEQLWVVYPHLTPFGDEREYLQIGLGDFVILRERFYRLVHNSFLLHGFYNYQHLILTRLERRGENFYYIGVPGNFYDREKQVALMYGFESFECAKEPAGQGDFGYYMIRVEL